MNVDKKEKNKYKKVPLSCATFDFAYHIRNVVLTVNSTRDRDRSLLTFTYKIFPLHVNMTNLILMS